jgi:hypothetical protein
MKSSFSGSSTPLSCTRNQARPHQGIRQQISESQASPVPPDHADGKVLSLPVLGGFIMITAEVPEFFHIAEDITA